MSADREVSSADKGEGALQMRTTSTHFINMYNRAFENRKYFFLMWDSLEGCCSYLINSNVFV